MAIERQGITTTPSAVRAVKVRQCVCIGVGYRMCVYVRVRAWRGRAEKEICLICGDRASGYHYNALSCEASVCAWVRACVTPVLQLDRAV